MTVGYLTYPRHTQIRRFLHWREHEHRSCVRTRSGDWFQFSRALQALGGMYGHCQTVILSTCIRFPVLGWSISRISTWRGFLYVAQIVSHGFSIFTDNNLYSSQHQLSGVEPCPGVDQGRGFPTQANNFRNRESGRRHGGLW